MSKQIWDGGAAFPCEQHEIQDGSWNQSFDPGMSLRDYFAAKFAQAELMTCGVPGEACEALAEAIAQTGETPEQHMARVAYEMADAMLKAREVHS